MTTSNLDELGTPETVAEMTAVGDEIAAVLPRLAAALDRVSDLELRFDRETAGSPALTSAEYNRAAEGSAARRMHELANLVSGLANVDGCLVEGDYVDELRARYLSS